MLFKQIHFYENEQTLRVSTETLQTMLSLDEKKTN